MAKYYLMKHLLLLLLLFPFTAQANNRVPDYDRYLRYTVRNGELAYFRVEDLPVRVCQMDDYGVSWNRSILSAIRQMNVAVPSVFSDPDHCDVFIHVVKTIPQGKCIRENGNLAPACAGPRGSLSYPVDIYIRSNFYQLAALLHELMHAYGVWVHPERWDSTVSKYRGANWRFNSRLTKFDIEILTYLYSLPAYTLKDQEVAKSSAEKEEDRFCAWVEAHGPFGISPSLTMEAYEKYRCGI